jgi:hypothetical protein
MQTTSKVPNRFDCSAAPWRVRVRVRFTQRVYARHRRQRAESQTIYCNRPYSLTFCPLPLVSSVYNPRKPGVEIATEYPANRTGKGGHTAGYNMAYYKIE